MTHFAKHLLAFAAAVLITTVSFSETVAVPNTQRVAPAALLA